MIQKIKDWYLFQGLGGKICAPILILAIAFFIVFSFIRNPDGATPRLAKMETKYFTVISHSIKFRLVNDGDRLWKDKMIIQSLVDNFAERVFSWMVETDPFTKELKKRIDMRAIIKKYELNLYGTQADMFNAYTEASYYFPSGNHKFLFYIPNIGFACEYTPGVLAALIIQSNVYKLNASKGVDIGYINQLLKNFTEWNRTRVQ